MNNENLNNTSNNVTSENNVNNIVQDGMEPMQNNINSISNSSTLPPIGNSTINNDANFSNINQNSQIQAPINIPQESKSDAPISKKQSSIIFLILAIISALCFFGKGILAIVGILLSVIGLIGSIIMLIKKAKLSALSLIVSIIVLVIYIVSLVISFNAVDSYVNQAKFVVFKNTAFDFVTSARNSVLINKKISCNNGSLKSVKESLPELASGGNTSPFGGNYDYKSSYVLVEAKEVNGSCQYVASIYLTDGIYSLGTPSNPILESDIDNTSIKKN